MKAETTPKLQYNKSFLTCLPSSQYSLSFLSCIIFVLLVALTTPIEWGDTGDYVSGAIKIYSSKEIIWDFGHLLWRPLGFLVLELSAWINALYPTSLVDNPVYFLTNIYCLISFFSGIGCALIVSRLVTKLYGDNNTVWGILIFLCFPPFYNYAQTGTPYITGLFFLLAGINSFQNLFYDRTFIGQGTKQRYFNVLKIVLFLLCSGLFWFPYYLSVPGLLMLTSLQFSRQTFIAVTKITVITAIMAAIIFVTISFLQGYTTLELMINWITSSSHGKIGHGGIARMIYGISNAHIDMGDFGKLIKKLLLDDPFTKDTIWFLFISQTWKLCLFYLFCFLTFISISKNPYLILAVLSVVVPNLLFAIAFDGGSSERYLTIAVAEAFTIAFIAHRKSYALLQGIFYCIFLITIVLCGVGRYWVAAVGNMEKLTLQRLNTNTPITPKDLIVVLNNADELSGLYKGYLYNPTHSVTPANVHILIRVGTSETQTWKLDFAKKALQYLASGNNIFISKRLFVEIPKQSWGWVEGEDRYVKWTDIKTTLNQLDTQIVTNNKDGFQILTKSDNNLKRLNSLAANN